MGITRDGAPSNQRISRSACSVWEITLESIVIALCVSNATQWGIGSRIVLLTYHLINLAADFAGRRDTLIATVGPCKLSFPKRALMLVLFRT